MALQGLDRGTVVARLSLAGCVAADEEADELAEAARGDDGVLRRLVDRRVAGEPLAWVTGSVVFAGRRVVVHPGVYVPRRQSEVLATRAAQLLPDDGLAVDLCTGAGALAAALAHARPTARVVATDVDPLACRCAADNGVEVFCGDLAEPLPDDLRGHVDVVTAVVPYVPTEELEFLPRDARDYEPLSALDGGPGGTRVLERAVSAAAGLLREGGGVVLELGGSQLDALRANFSEAGFGAPRPILDEDGDLRGAEAQLLTRARGSD